MNLKLDIDPHTVCRICLSQQSPTNNLMNFFSNTVVEGYIISVPDMVTKCLDIEVTNFYFFFVLLHHLQSRKKKCLQSDADDGLPDKICDACKKEITNFHLFKEKSARTEQILLTTFDKPIRKKGKNRNSSVDGAPKPQTSTVGIQTVTEPQSFTCLECKMIFKTESVLSKHINTKHSTKKTETACQTDEVEMMTEDHYIEELHEMEEVNYKHELKLEVLEVDDIDIDEMNVDDMDDEAVSEPKSDLPTDYELIEKEQEEYQCNDCLAIFPLVESFQNHKCPKALVHIVSDTSNTLIEPDEISEHFYKINEVDLYECYRCHESFPNLDEFTEHRNLNDCQKIDFSFKIQQPRTKVEDFHHCNLCKDKRFKTTTTFNQHQKLHESIEVVIDYLDCSPCDDCHKIFLNKDDRQQHECPKKRKNSDGEFIDESCTDYQYLEQDGDFLCDKCPMEFPSISIAKLHIVTHAKEFVCPFEGCGCSYEIWSRFAMHLSTKHLNAKQHNCKFCETECESFDALQAHYKDECPEKKFKCDHCGKI